MLLRLHLLHILLQLIQPLLPDRTLRQMHPNKARRDATIGFGAVELGNQTLDKLAEYLSKG